VDWEIFTLRFISGSSSGFGTNGRRLLWGR